MRWLIFMALLGVLEALHCNKEFNYYDNYGNGFDITCQGLTREHIHLLANITITNEISLTIENATLTNISSAIFQNVHDLRFLRLENSTITFSKMKPIFDVLSKLEHLAVVNTDFYVSKYTFVGLNRLKELILNNNKLEEFEPGSFQNVPNLSYLEVTRNRIHDMKTLPLCELQNLKGLNLSRNLITDLNQTHFYCRESDKTVDFNLNDDNYILDVKKRDYFSISDISFKLSTLDLSHNNISKIGFALSDLKNLKVLNLQGNLLVKIENKELSSLENIEKIYLSHNLLNSIEEKVFNNNNQKFLKYLDISNNKLNYFSLNNTPTLEYINLAHNMLNSSSLDKINNTKSLKTIIIVNNNIVDIHVYTLKKFIALEVLDLGGNSIKLKEHLFDGLHSLQHLSLRNNNIEELPKYLFKNLTNLRNLDLSYNRLKYIRYNDTFQGLHLLETLNISYNLLQELNYAVLEPLKNLNVLDIAGNQLHYIQYDLIISDLPLLSVLNIKSNFLSCELLYKIIKFLRGRDISYTINEQFDFEQENVAGIYCNTEKNIISESLKKEGMSSERNTLVLLGVVISIILAVIIIAVALFKIHIYLKRRKYRADEFELIDE